MIRLSKAVSSWGTPEFNACLKEELEATLLDELPLEKVVLQGGVLDPQTLAIMVLSFTDAGDCLIGRVALMFDEIVGGCSCGDDPAPTTTYRELHISIDKRTTEVTLAFDYETLQID